MGRIRIALVCFGLAASVLAGASIAGAEGPAPEPTAPAGAGEPAVPLVGCHESVICTYTQAEYSEPFFDINCSTSGAVGLSGNRHSATNRCGNKTDWLRENGSVVACMNPGGNRPSPGAFNEVFVAAEFGAFC